MTTNENEKQMLSPDTNHAVVNLVAAFQARSVAKDNTRAAMVASPGGFYALDIDQDPAVKTQLALEADAEDQVVDAVAALLDTLTSAEREALIARRYR